MSALPPEADIPRRNLNVRFGPKADMHRGKQHRYVVAGKHPSRNRPGNLPDGSFIQCVLRERLCTFERKYRFALVIFCRGGAMPLIARRPPAL